jgi:hypothetical protein
MALYKTHFTCFDDVEQRYNTTKPIKGPKHKDHDVRPIGDRNRKWERIVKIDNDCYALSDGHHRGDAVFPAWGRPDISPADMEKFAPIVWRRYGQGVEKVTIRNGIGPYVHTTRYMFLNRHMPAGLTFVQTQQGKQFVRMRGTETPLFLAKGTHVTAGEYADILKDRAQLTAAPLRSVNRWATGTEDTTSLTFLRVGTGQWEFISNNGVAPPVPRTRVDADHKAQYKDAIKQFCEWAFTVGPMLNVADYNTRREYEQQFRDWCQEQGIPQRGWGTMSRRAAPEVFRTIMADADHPMRIVMMVAMLHEADVNLHAVTTKEDVSAIRSRINRWLNKVLGFTTKVIEERE